MNIAQSDMFGLTLLGATCCFELVILNHHTALSLNRLQFPILLAQPDFNQTAFQCSIDIGHRDRFTKLRLARFQFELSRSNLNDIRSLNIDCRLCCRLAKRNGQSFFGMAAGRQNVLGFPSLFSNFAV